MKATRESVRETMEWLKLQTGRVAMELPTNPTLPSAAVMKTAIR
jgi:hypothetical protein